MLQIFFFFFSSRRRHTRLTCDWSSDVCSSDLPVIAVDQRECTFTPRVVVVAAGGRIDFLNSDRLLHNLHSIPNANPPFNRTQPKGRTIPITFAHPEIIR